MEKKGGTLKFHVLIDSFRSLFVNNDLFDLGFLGCEFTWSIF